MKITKNRSKIPKYCWNLDEKNEKKKMDQKSRRKFEKLVKNGLNYGKKSLKIIKKLAREWQKNELKM